MNLSLRYTKNGQRDDRDADGHFCQTFGTPLPWTEPWVQYSGIYTQENSIRGKPCAQFDKCVEYHHTISKPSI